MGGIGEAKGWGGHKEEGTGGISEHSTHAGEGNKAGQLNEAGPEIVQDLKIQRGIWVLHQQKGETLRLEFDPLPSCSTVTSFYKAQF